MVLKHCLNRISWARGRDALQILRVTFEAAVASRYQQIDELRSELSDIVSRLEVVESG